MCESLGGKLTGAMKVRVGFGQPRRDSAAILMFKLIIKLGYRSERLIQKYSSFFSPKSAL